MLNITRQVVLALLLPLAAVPAQSGAGRPAPALDERGAAPTVLEGGKPGARALVIALHGGSYTERDPLRLAERCRDALSAAARSEGLRLLVPVAPEPQARGVVSTAGLSPHGGPPARDEGRAATDVFQVPWLQPEGEARVLGLIEAEVAARRADPARISLAGHGAGATGVLLLAARHPTRIAAVAAWAGTPSPLWDEDRRLVGLAGDPVPALADMPLYLWTARDDTLLDRAVLSLFTRTLEAQRTAKTASRSGVGRSQRSARPPPLQLVDAESGGHGYGAGGPREGLAFLRAQRRTARP